ncbi:phage tail-collar fiber domain-containing protein [Microbulbifer sp. SSSA005]|uniref:phage tail-collar fiber domain-containing protein n=1 Tax=Microbulbifer sp. SSSA005 TaxID=3243378 RepID=UPI00403996D7
MSIGILTNAGRDLFAQKAASGDTLIINRFLLANIPDLDSATSPDPDEPMPALENRVREFSVTRHGYVSNDKVVYSVYLDSSEGDYTFNWVGLLADDDTLIAVRYIEPIRKYKTSGTEVGNSITRNFMVTYTDAQAITNITIDANTWQLAFDTATESQAGLSRIANQEKVDNGDDDFDFVTSQKLALSKRLKRTFTNLADFLADVQLREGQFVEILGREVAGDDGANAYQMVSANTAAHDNGSYIDHPNSGLQAKGMFPKGVVYLEQFGATSGGSVLENSEVQAALDFARDQNLPWRGRGNYWVEAVTAYTPSDSDCTLVADTSSEDAVLTIANPNPKETLSNSIINDVLPLYKGQTNIPGLGEHYGKYIRAASTDQYLARTNYPDMYRTELHFMVTTPEGDIWPPLPFDVPDNTVFSVVEAEPILPRLEVSGVNIRTLDGSGIRTCLYRCSRSAVTFKSSTLENTSEQSIGNLYQVSNAYGCVASSVVVKGAMVNTTNYGFNHSGANHRLVTCEALYCRRSVDASYQNWLVIEGGSFPDGIGAHLGFNIKAGRASIGWYKTGDLTSLQFTGGDISVDDCDLTTQRAIFNIRSDAPEVIGSIKITNSRLTIDVTEVAAVDDVHIVMCDKPQEMYDSGRNINTPKHILVSGNTIKLKGSIGINALYLLQLFNGGTLVRNQVVDTLCEFTDNSYDLEDSSTITKILFNKEATDLGPGLRFYSNDELPNFQPYLANSIANYSEPFAYVTAKRAINSQAKMDSGFVKKAVIGDAVFSFATSTPPDHKERWYSVSAHSDNPRITKRIPDDDVAILEEMPLYSVVEIHQRNGMNVFATVLVDGSGTPMLKGINQSDAVDLVADTALNGTTGSDGKFTVSSTATALYMENRTGETLPISIHLREL